jgi:hypothetical protein
MKRTWIIASLAVIAVVGTFADTKKESKAGARQQLVDPPVAPASAPAMSAHPSPYNFAGVQYPRIEADNRVTFRFTAPNAQKVQVSIVNVPFDMVKGPDGVWTYTSAPQAPGYHNYWMIVDGAIVLDPGTQAFIGYGHMCNGFEVPEPGVDWYDLKTIYSGQMAIPEEFNKKVKVLFMSCGSMENPDDLRAHQQQLAAAGITNSHVYVSPGTAHEWQTWRRSLYAFAPLLFR